MRGRWFQALAGLYALWTFAYLARLSGQLIHSKVNEEREARAPFWMLSLEPRTLSAIRPEAAAAGVLAGDRILSLEGRPFSGLSEWARQVESRRPGDLIGVTVETPPPGTRREVKIRLRSAASDGSSRSPIDVCLLALRLLQPPVIFALGWFVVWRRPRQLAAYLLVGFLLGLAELLGDGLNSTRQVAGWGAVMRIPALLHISFWWSGCILFVFWLSLEVPERLREGVRRPWLKALVLAPLLGYSAWLAVAKTGASENLPAWEPVVAAVRAWFFPVLYVQYGLLLAAGAAFVLQWRRAASQDSRRRMHVLLAGFCLAFFPLLALEIGKMITRRPAPALWVLTASLTLMAFPAAMAYVIGVGRANDLKLVVRESIQYLLLRRGVAVMQAIAGVVVFIWLTLGVPHWSEWGRAAAIGFGLVSIAITGRISQRLGRWIDRVFFRDAAAAEQVLRDLAVRVGETRQMSDVARLTIEEVCRALRARGGEFRSGDQTLFRFGETQAFELEMPIERAGHRFGALALGARQSDAPYSDSDRSLLEAVASQAALAMDNCELNEQVSRDIARREILQRELQLAREVQTRLLPQQFPIAPHAVVEGSCRPAEEVGGDYFDVIVLPEGDWLLAVADVAGKGISAAIIMASLQAALRGRAAGGVSNVAELAEDLNRFLYSTTPKGRFITAVLAHFRRKHGEIEYICAGHSPPLLLSPGKELRTLAGRGLGLGLTPNARYEKQTESLSPGGTLFLYTDGIPEARNSEGEEFGEERVRQAARAGCAADLISAASLFAAGAPQHDDMTVLTLRRLV